MALLTQTTALSFAISPPLFWLIAGIVLCATEFSLLKSYPLRFKWIALMMGVCALIVSFILWRGAIALSFNWRYIMYEDFDIQIMYWMGMSLAFVIWIRPIFIQRKPFHIQDATEAIALTEILPGAIGRVLYEGCSWQARCEPSSSSITPHQTVYVLRREGNTLIIVSEHLFRLEN